LKVALPRCGTQTDRHNKLKWLAPTGVLPVNGAKFMNWNCGRGSGGAISQVIHLHHLDFKAAVDWPGRNFPDTLSLSAAAPTAQLGLKLTVPAPSRSPTTLKNQCFREDYRVLLPTAAAIVMSAFLKHPPPSLHAAMNFTPTQRNAIDHTPGSLQLFVCAGSG
jgi:hypothetical protein